MATKIAAEDRAKAIHAMPDLQRRTALHMVAMRAVLLPPDPAFDLEASRDLAELSELEGDDEFLQVASLILLERTTGESEAEAGGDMIEAPEPSDSAKRWLERNAEAIARIEEIAEDAIDAEMERGPADLLRRRR